MNLSLDQYLSSLERSVSALPGVFAEWSSIEDELKDEYGDQLSWLLGEQPGVLHGAGDRLVEVATRLARANEAVLQLAGLIDERMGIKVGSLVLYGVQGASLTGPTFGFDLDDDNASERMPVAA